MNYGTHITHYKGQPIRYMSNTDLQAALVAEMKAYQSLMENYNNLIMKQGRAIIEQNKA